jgi:purine-binding chemotaxis protein CheW
MSETITKSKEQQVSQKQDKYLTFKLNNEEYGLEILKVREIIGYIEPTEIPRTNDYVKGVVNLRGQVVPVIDLRTRFGMPEAEITEKTCIIVVQIEHNDTLVNTSIIVDQVEEVLNINEDDIECTEQFGTNVNSDFILGIAKMEDSVTILLDIDKILSAGEIVDLQK